MSLLVEGTADLKRHRNDAETNSAPCVILKRTEEFILEPNAERDPQIVKGRDCIVNINKAFYLNSAHPNNTMNNNTPAGGGNGGSSNNNAAAAPPPVSTPLAASDGQNVRIAFQRVRRMDIRQGHLVLVKNREMVPADLVLLASSNDHGSAYIETSSIDGETNLKLRTSPHLPKDLLKHLRAGSIAQNLSSPQAAPSSSNALSTVSEIASGEQLGSGSGSGDLSSIDEAEEEEESEIETIEMAVKRITRFSYLGRPAGKSALLHPEYAASRASTTHDNNNNNNHNDPTRPSRRRTIVESLKKMVAGSVDAVQRFSAPSEPMDHTPGPGASDDGKYIAALTSEPPNPSVHTFSGKLTLPPFDEHGSCHDIALDAENVLLRGAVIRNTEWVIGVAFFTGTDTKLVQNSFKTKSKFSQLDILMNKTVVAILCIMFSAIIFLASMAVTTTNRNFDGLFYVGLNRNANEPWPYLPNLPPPQWVTVSQNWFQYFFLYITLLNNFVPLSLYVTVEAITFCMIWLVNVDLDMYDDTTNTRAVARSSIITDLGRIQYIFSDKTGTLTQNVMRFKRCSVDGLVFGAPIQKTRPGGPDAAPADKAASEPDDSGADEPTRFYPLRQLLVGQFRAPPRSAEGLEGLGGSVAVQSEAGGAAATTTTTTTGKTLTFNAEMFLRALSLCHTVVVEKDIDKKETIDSGVSVGSTSSRSSRNFTQSFFNRKRTDTSDSLPPVAEDRAVDFNGNEPGSAGARERTVSQGSIAPGQLAASMKSTDGAPGGYAYQAESPDEGALVSAASKTFGFQVVSRDSSGIRLRLGSPSHLRSRRVTDGLKTGTVLLKHLAAETASELTDDGEAVDSAVLDEAFNADQREEVWTILAVNKFDSDRKRMSILLRSPPELGGLPILFCKGADSSMLDPTICNAMQLLQNDNGGGGTASTGEIARPPVIHLRTVSEPTEHSGEDNPDAVDEEGWEMAQVLGLQAHLGDFAKEGLRTLVLGMRVLGEEECTEWLAEYKQAATSMSNRAELLTKAATKIETQIHIVGATAIEDKLQTNVPETIATLAKAGIKLWVLTGDKRETAVEIGYSTLVLTPKMHLTEVPDNGKTHVCTQMAMEFIRLVKMGRLAEYQKSALDDTGSPTWKQRMKRFGFAFSKSWRAVRLLLATLFASLWLALGFKARAADRFEAIAAAKEFEKNRVIDSERRRRVRAHAEKLIKDWLESEEGQRHRKLRPGENDELSLASEETPGVFNRASSAKSMLRDLKSKGKLSQSQLRELSLAALTVNQTCEDEPLVDEDTLSLESFFPGNKDDLRGDFDKRKRTILERLFANDREVRKGHLGKHVKSERRFGVPADEQAQGSAPKPAAVSDGPRALVIEGAALKHLLGNPELEAILFAVASNCDAVIACRSSPKQKAELLNLVRHNVKPEPITLAIGDGANDVGMIQEAHVGIGISGKEGKQAVNASDFSIAQFRFLENLILIHGRWNFYRLSTVVYFSFYKNALMAGILICYAPAALYSGTPLYDQWLIAMLNFVAGIPIIVLGLFDRFLSKEYVRKNPEVYKATRNNELITLRSLFRWITLVLVHIFTLYYMTVPTQRLGGGMTGAWNGLMRNKFPMAPGNGEGGDLKSVGTVTFTCMIVLLAYKVRVCEF